jgi:hypothetical protein
LIWFPAGSEIALTATRTRLQKWTEIFATLRRRRFQELGGNVSIHSYSVELKYAMKKIFDERFNIRQIIGRSMHIASISFNFNIFGNADCPK